MTIHGIGTPARSVAEALADIVNGSEAHSNGAIPEIGGPRPERLVEMARLFVAQRGDTTRVEEVANPDDPDHELLENGALFPGPDAALAGPTFEEWVQANASRSDSLESLSPTQTERAGSFWR